MKFEQLFLLSNVFNNGFIGTLFRQAEFNGIDEKMSAKKKHRMKRLNLLTCFYSILYDRLFEVK